MNPLTEIPEWSIIDPSKIQALIVCPRRFFFQYILGWRLNINNIHLVFGSSWHLAHEYLLQHDYSLDSVNEAHKRFSKEYFETYTEKDTLVNSPKNSDRAFLALCDYTGKYRQDLEKFENLSIEIPVRFKIGNYTVVGRLDSINKYKDGRGIFSLDHKTGTSYGNFWTSQWDVSLQVGLYYHVLNTLYGVDNVYGIIMGGTFFHKVKDDSQSILHEFHRYTIRKKPEEVYSIVLDAQQWLDFWDLHMNKLMKTSISDKHMTAFPRICKSCAIYGKMCPYKDMCSAWSNPLQHIYHKPVDFKLEYWNPLTSGDTTKEVIDI